MKTDTWRKVVGSNLGIGKGLFLAKTPLKFYLYHTFKNKTSGAVVVVYLHFRWGKWQRHAECSYSCLFYVSWLTTLGLDRSWIETLIVASLALFVRILVKSEGLIKVLGPSNNNLYK